MNAQAHSNAGTFWQHACENAQAKLAAYQSIELHLNKAVEGIDLFSEATGEDAERQILSLGAGLPTDPQRRLVQIMSLASKVVEQQKKLQQLTRRSEILILFCGRAVANKAGIHVVACCLAFPFRTKQDDSATHRHVSGLVPILLRGYSVTCYAFW